MEATTTSGNSPMTPLSACISDADDRAVVDREVALFGFVDVFLPCQARVTLYVDNHQAWKKVISLNAGMIHAERVL